MEILTLDAIQALKTGTKKDWVTKLTELASKYPDSPAKLRLSNSWKDDAIAKAFDAWQQMVHQNIIKTASCCHLWQMTEKQREVVEKYDSARSLVVWSENFKLFVLELMHVCEIRRDGEVVNSSLSKIGAWVRANGQLTDRVSVQIDTLTGSFRKQSVYIALKLSARGVNNWHHDIKIERCLDTEWDEDAQDLIEAIKPVQTSVKSENVDFYQLYNQLNLAHAIALDFEQFVQNPVVWLNEKDVPTYFSGN